jgi:hypothetical protein
MIVFGSFLKKKDSNDDLITLKNGKNKIVISDLSDGATAQDMWIQNSEQKIKNLELTNKKQEEYSIKLEEKIRKLENELGVLEEVNYQTNQNKINSVAQQEQISALYEELKSLRTKQSQNPYAGTYDNTTGQIVPQARTIETIELNLESSSSSNSNNTFNIKDYIPAGSYAPATVISGVDASTGLAASGDPRPVLFRITGEAISSGYKGKKQKTDLEGCTVTGAASADLSSEKVYVRLLKMTCSRKKGTVTEIEVQGYATAVGKAGIRGPVVSREGNLLMQSFFAGVVGGMGNMYSKSLQPPLEINSGIATEQQISSNDIMKSGLSQGVGNASDRLAQYLIDRAEQYQPVISIPSNIDVELVFHTGVHLDGNNHNNNNANTNNNSANNNKQNNIRG